MKNYRVHFLRDQPWYKSCLDRGLEEHARIRDWLNQHLPEEAFMYKSVNKHMIIMFKDLENYALAKLALNLTTKEARGLKVWGPIHQDSHDRYALVHHNIDPDRAALIKFRKGMRDRWRAERKERAAAHK
jgi:hypothetical protein